MLIGRLEDAKHWLRKAFKIGDPFRIKLMALKDPDLEPLWREIRRETWLCDDDLLCAGTEQMGGLCIGPNANPVALAARTARPPNRFRIVDHGLALFDISG
jgi:hypothetical protein